MLKWTGMLFQLFVAFPLMAQPFADRNTSTGLKDIVRLQERTENGKTLGLALGTIPQDVDINSVIEVDISADQLINSLRYKSKTQLRPEQQALLEAANRLQASADILAEGLRLTAELEQTDRGTKKFKNTAREIQQHFRKSIPALRSYNEFITQHNIGASNRQRTSFIRRLDYAAKTGKWESVISDEIQWLIQELEKTGQSIIRDSEPVALNLVAYRILADQKTFIHLEHYDNFEPGIPQPFDKLNVVPSPDQVGKLRETYAKAKEISDKLNEIEDSREQLRESLNIILKQHGVNLAELEAATEEFQQKLDAASSIDWKMPLLTMRDRIEMALADSSSSPQKSKLLAVRTRLQRMESKFESLENRVVSIRQTISELSPRLDKAAMNGKSDPVAALLTVLDKVSTTQNTFEDIVNTMKSLANDTQALAVNTKNLSQELTDLLAAENIEETIKTELNAIASDFSQQTILPVHEAAQRVYSAVDDVLKRMKNVGVEAQQELNAYAATEIIPPDTSYFVPLIQAKNTWLDLREVKDNAEGSTVILQASLYHLKQEDGEYIPSKLIDKETQTLRILRYGHYGEYSVGLAYVLSDSNIAGQSVRNRGFAPQVSWVMHHRNWRDVNEPAYYVKNWHEHIGYGLHTVALDLNNDNETEIGLGITLSLIDELLQLGYGIDLSNDKKYYFIATRLFNF